MVEQFQLPPDPFNVTLFWRYFYFGLYLGDACCNFLMGISLFSLFFYQAGRLSVLSNQDDESYYYDSEVSRILKNKQ
jgi:hypothetical protein